MITDMYGKAITSVRISGWIISALPITIDLHQGSTLSPYFFAIVMDELTKLIQEVSWYMGFFVDDMILIDQN